MSPVASLSTTRTRQTTSTESSTGLELSSHSSSSRNSSSSTTVSSTTRPSSSDVLTESTSSLDVSSLSDDSSSEDQGGGSTEHNAALIGGIAGGAVLLTALIFFIWRCAKQRDDRQRRESGQWDTAQSEDGGEKANTMRDISNPILKSSTLDPLSNAREHHVQFPWQSDRASDDGSIFKEEAAGRASTAPVSAFTYADGSNVDLAALPRRADSPALSFRTDTSAETKRSIPRVPPPAESLPPPIPVAAAFSHPYQQKMSNPRLPTLSTVPNPRDSAASSGSHWTLAAGSAEHLPGQAFTTDLPRDRQSEANEEFTFKRLPPITSVLGPDEEVLKSPAAKKNGRQRSATLTWLRGPWD